MKKLLLFFFVLYSLSFAIIDFEGINWGDSKSDLDILFSNLKKEPSLNENIEMYSLNNPKEDVSSYIFFLKNGALYKIRVNFDKESVGKAEIQAIYKSLNQKIGSPISKVPILKEIDDLTLKGNSLKYIPDLSTTIYFNGVDTINKFGKMIDSNLYLEYVDSTTEYDF